MHQMYSNVLDILVAKEEIMVRRVLVLVLIGTSILVVLTILVLIRGSKMVLTAGGSILVVLILLTVVAVDISAVMLTVTDTFTNW